MHDVCTTFVEVLRTAAARHPDRTAVHVAGEAPVPYAGLWRDAHGVAGALRASHPSARHVGIVQGNSARWVASLYGAALAGRTSVLLNPRLTGNELRYQIEQSECGVLLAGPLPGRDRPAVLDAVDGSEHDVPLVWTGDDAPAGATGWSRWIDGGASGDAAEPCEHPGGPDEPGPDDTAVIIYTSGTTALPKGVMLSHGSIVGNARYVGECFGMDDRDSVFSAGPFFHSGGLTMHVVLAGSYGIPALSVPAFDPDAVLDFVEDARPTVYNGIETLFLRLTDSPRFDRRRVASIRTGWATGTPAILHRIAEEIGVPGIIGVYGISEASPNVTIASWTDSPEHRLETVGRPRPDTEVAIWDETRGETAATGELGEIIVRGPGLMRGYYRKPEETAEALRDGWLHTGDLGRLRTDGYMEFAGRMKDIVRMGGENVSCAEVENAIYALGGVELAAVVPVADDRYGEIPVAAVKFESGAGRPESQVIDALRGNLAGYKVPRRVLSFDDMPLTASGKVQKSRLRDRILPLL